MITERKQKETKSKFNLEKIKVAKLDNLHLINGGHSGIIANAGDDKTITQTNKTIDTISF